jgi:hypothetical protein
MEGCQVSEGTLRIDGVGIEEGFEVGPGIAFSDIGFLVPGAGGDPRSDGYGSFKVEVTGGTVLQEGGCLSGDPKAEEEKKGEEHSEHEEKSSMLCGFHLHGAHWSRHGGLPWTSRTYA